MNLNRRGKAEDHDCEYPNRTEEISHHSLGYSIWNSPLCMDLRMFSKVVQQKVRFCLPWNMGRCSSWRAMHLDDVKSLI